MLAAAVAGAERDQPRVFRLGQRHARLGDPGQPRDRGAAGQHFLGFDAGEIGAPTRNGRAAAARSRAILSWSTNSAASATTAPPTAPLGPSSSSGSPRRNATIA